MNLDRVASLLASGLKPSQVATIVGASPGRISQLIATEEFQLQLSAKTALIDKEDIEEKSLTAKYLAAEHALIQQVMEMAPVAELRDVTAALRVVGERQEKMKARTLAPPSQITQQTFVSISLPSHAISRPSVERTSSNEITAIGGNTIAPLNALAVTNLFASLKGDTNVQATSIGKPEEGTPFPKGEGIVSLAEEIKAEAPLPFPIPNKGREAESSTYSTSHFPLSSIEGQAFGQAQFPLKAIPIPLVVAPLTEEEEDFEHYSYG